MILNKHGHKRTANEAAKEFVYEFGANAYHWQEKIYDVYAHKATEREVEQVRLAIHKHLTRVAKLLGNPDPTRNKEDDK